MLSKKVVKEIAKSVLFSLEGVDGVGAGAKVAWADLCCPKKEWVLV